MASDNLGLGPFADGARIRLEQALRHYLPDPARSDAPRLAEAMRYAVLAGGKRIRPLLVYAACQLSGGTPAQADAPATAVELIHAYSLVHDDLPAMDNDDLRRGQPTCHRAFDEATAILAGDTLLTMAFELLGDAGDYPAATRVGMVRALAGAAGAAGMAAGQMQDMEAEGRLQQVAALERMHYLKTGRLITASLHLGYLAANRPDPALEQALLGFGDAIGLAFQIQDDILDVTVDTAQLGKPSGSDEKQGKSTFPALIGLEASRERAQTLCQQARGHLQGHGEAARPLLDLADYIVRRGH
ncbi:geranylgeranyl pyrophosphate synthetase [Alcanivorax xiamenensis]|uniref:Geranylgeranyl pyrophosphate synthetase n=1 Tax=Alcanivorax xiamenensis TaxID=1177156 RepID=A0ABQ6YCS1_9GAMM|nr:MULTISPECIES: farnesyl diphosphate synthase [Alcanivorax]KAF0807609.1 geranylgeranyl pyrophosphate synthetase [Alcanivorax xiamenensis]